MHNINTFLAKTGKKEGVTHIATPYYIIYAHFAQIRVKCAKCYVLPKNGVTLPMRLWLSAALTAPANAVSRME